MEFLLFLSQYYWIIIILLAVSTILMPIVVIICIVRIRSECIQTRELLEAIYDQNDEQGKNLK